MTHVGWASRYVGANCCSARQVAGAGHGTLGPSHSHDQRRSEGSDVRGEAGGRGPGMCGIILGTKKTQANARRSLTDIFSEPSRSAGLDTRWSSRCR